MRAAGHSCSPRNNNATVSGQQLADLFLHVGSDLLFEATDRTEADMNDLCLLFSSLPVSTNGVNKQEMAGRDRLERLLLLSPVVLKQTPHQDSDF